MFETTSSVWHFGGCGGISGKKHIVESLCAEKRLNCGASDVNSVGNDFSRDVRLGEDGADYAWIAVRKRAHGVVEVHGMPGSSLNRGASLFVIRIREIG